MATLAEEGSVDERDEELLRRAIGLSERARDHGNQPFGALVAGPDREVLLEAENTIVTERDPTCHAETNLLRSAVRRFDLDLLGRSTMYTSCEPCPMCAGTAYWANVRRVVFGLDLPTLDAIARSENPTPHLRARDVLGGWLEIVVEGPALVDEARVVHEGFWR
jgi:tRNA(Arg) A34 adenosine deaminase TadA